MNIIRKVFLGLTLVVTSIVVADLTGDFLRICKEGVCYIKKTADATYNEFKTNAEKFLSNVLQEVTKPISLDVPKFFAVAGKMKTDVGTLRVDVDLLKSQIGQDGTTLDNAKNIIEAIDKFENAVKALKNVNPPYSKTELATAITGVPGSIEWLWGGRSKQVEAHFKDMLAQYGVLSSTIPKLDIQRIAERIQGLIFEIVSIMDNVTDMRKATGDIGNSFIPDDLTTDFRGLREDLAKISTRVGTLSAYKSYIVGGPLSNTALAQKVGTVLIGSIFNLGTITSQLKTVKDSIDKIKVFVDTLKQEGKIAEDLGKNIQSEANVANLKSRIKKRIQGTSNILKINEFALEEIQRTVKSIRSNARNLIMISLTMLEQVTTIIEYADKIGNTLDKIMGGNFIQPAALKALDGLASDLYSIKARATRIHGIFAKIAA